MSVFGKSKIDTSYRVMNGTSTHFVLCAGSGSSGGYNRGRNDYQNADDDNGSGGYSRGRNDDRGGSGYNRGRSDHQSNDDRGGSGYSRGRNDHYSDHSGGGGGYGGDDNRMETQRDTIFIQNLPRNVTMDELRTVFSQIGVIKVRFYFFKLALIQLL